MQEMIIIKENKGTTFCAGLRRLGQIYMKKLEEPKKDSLIHHSSQLLEN